MSPMSTNDSQSPANDVREPVEFATVTRRRRWFVAIVTVVLMSGLLFGYVSLLRQDGFQWIEWLTLGLFTLLGGWIAFSLAWHCWALG